MRKKSSSFRRPLSATRQRGVALVVALILLVVITLTGLGAMRNAIQQERMSGNSVDRALAMQAAESALQEAQNIIQNSNGIIPAGATNCPQTGVSCPANPDSQNNGIAGVAWQNVTTQYQPTSGSFSSITPQYAIQFLGWYTQVSPTSIDPNAVSTDVVWMYRINARSYDPAVTQNRAFVSLQANAQVQTKL